MMVLYQYQDLFWSIPSGAGFFASTVCLGEKTHQKLFFMTFLYLGGDFNHFKHIRHEIWGNYPISSCVLLRNEAPGTTKNVVGPLHSEKTGGTPY